MNVTIVGGGNIGTQFAVHCAEKNHRVTVYTSKPEKFSKALSIVDENGNVTHQGQLALATNDPALAFSQAELIFVTVPADCMASYGEAIYPHIRPGVKIGLIPGTGGGECVFLKCREKGAILFGLQRVPSVSRLVKYGQQVCSTGYRAELFAAALPKRETAGCCRLLIACDAEVQNLCRALTDFDLSGVKSLKDHYESQTAEAMTHKISHIPAFQGLPSPQIAVEGGFIPDLNSRYFTADFSYGLAILVQIARMANVPAPNMEQTLQWYQTLAGNPKMFDFTQWGIHNYEDLIAFYRQ